MTEDDVTLNRMEQRRLMVLNQLEAGGLVNEEAAALLGVSVAMHARYASTARATTSSGHPKSLSMCARASRSRTLVHGASSCASKF
jgi:hypothetical protein